MGEGLVVLEDEINEKEDEEDLVGKLEVVDRLMILNGLDINKMYYLCWLVLLRVGKLVNSFLFFCKELERIMRRFLIILRL